MKAEKLEKQKELEKIQAEAKSDEKQEELIVTSWLNQVQESSELVGKENYNN